MSDAFGKTETDAGQGFAGTCFWTIHTTPIAQLQASIFDTMLESARALWSDPIDLEIAGHPAAYSHDQTRQLFVATDDGGAFSLSTSGVPAEVDLQETLVSLAALAMPRLASLPTPTPGPTPMPLGGDAELNAMFPTTIAGEPVTMNMSLTGDQMEASIDTTSPQQVAFLDALKQQLAGLGKSLSDLSYASGHTSTGQLTGLRIKGADASAAMPVLMQLLSSASTDLQQSAATIGGKSVIWITQGPVPTTDDPSAAHIYAYPKDDVLWLVSGTSQSSIDFLAALP